MISPAKEYAAVSTVDLHVHTTASDGIFSPSDIVRMAARNGLRAIAISDHDTVSGIAEAMATGAEVGLEVIPAVELSCDVPSGEVHILGYYIDYAYPPLLELLKNLREARFGRARRMVEKLAGLGMPLSWDSVQEMAAGESVGRPHIARAMVEKGYAKDTTECFDLYIGRTGPAYVERYKLEPEAAVQLITAASGIPVYAHPDQSQPEFANIQHLIDKGLAGIEAHYAGFTESQIEDLVRIADNLGIVATGGTDFHGFGEDEVPLGGVFVPPTIIQELRQLRSGVQPSD